MALRMTSHMAIAMAVASEQNKAHSTPLQTTTPHLSFVVVSGEDQIQSDRHLGALSAPIGLGDLR